jgi:MscS family membrane protein
MAEWWTEARTMLTDFWEVVVTVWQTGFLGADLGRFLAALLIFVIFLVIRRLFATLVIGNLKKATRRTKTDLDDKALAALKGPLQFIPIVMGAFAAKEIMVLEGTFLTIGDNLIISMVTFTIFWALYNLITPFSAVLYRLERVLTNVMVEWIIKVIRGIVIVVGGAAVLEIWGISVAPVLAGFGLLGVAVALGAQDLFKNLIAGMMILVEKRFKAGDWVRVDGVVEGTVVSIGLRSTTVRRFDRAPVQVPNAALSDNAITNFSMMSHRRIFWTIGVEYRTTKEQLRQIRDGIENYLLENDDFAHPPEAPLFVRIDSFNDSSIDIMVYCFTRTIVWGEWLEIKERLAYRIKEIVEEAGTSFAFPSRSLYLETVPGPAAEVFQPPVAKDKAAQ